ncbi:hypothetical protein ACQ4WP_26825 [Janthinobacterium sp. GB4P2]
MAINPASPEPTAPRNRTLALFLWWLLQVLEILLMTWFAPVVAVR